jgi:lipopolysaccharide/colanic/teichoic acid biosynthesis glycosyltransferase
MKRPILGTVPAGAPWLGGRHVARRLARLTLLLSADLLAIGSYGLLVEASRFAFWTPPGYGLAVDQLLPSGSILAAGLPVVVMLTLAALGAYTVADPGQAIARRTLAAVVAVNLPAWAALWQGTAPLLAESDLLLTAGLALFLIAAFHASRTVLQAVAPRRLRAARVLLVAGERDIPRAYAHPALSDARQYSIRGAFDPAELAEPGALEVFCQSLRRCDADTVVLCCGPLGDHAFGVVVDAANAMGCDLISLGRTRESAAVYPAPRNGPELTSLVSPVSRTLQLIVKRGVDIAGASLGLLLTAPVLGVLALAVRFESPGPVLFGHRRVGAWGRPFRCLKFRTMRVDAEPLLRSDPAMYSEYVRNNYKLPEGRDPRITRVGRLLRKTSLDELPQLWNVLRGDMSLIGPRPVVPDELTEYGGHRRVLLSVKPGITGEWAITGRSNVGYPQRAAIEIGYVRRWRLIADLAILWRTVPSVLTRRGAH